jgi:hypothetical protein
MGVTRGQTVETPVYSILAPPTGVQAGIQQGTTVAVDGNYVVVGCPLDDVTDTDVGVVKIYAANNGALLYVLKCPSASQGERFGSAVAISGTRVLVGDPNYAPSVSLSASGRAYVYDLAGATPTVPVLTLENPSPAQTDRFGFAVAISANLAVIGAPYHRVSGVATAGSAYVYDLTSGTPTTPKYTLQKTTPASADNFGYSVSIGGTRIVVGVPGDSISASKAGKVYIYELTSGLPTSPIYQLLNPNGALAANDSFGNAVSINSGGIWVAVGASNGGDGSGAVYAYNLSGTTPTVPFATLRDPKLPGAAQTGTFGAAVAISNTRIIVGAPLEIVGGLNQSGSAYVFEMISSTPATAIVLIDNPTSAAGDKFGTSVALAGSRAIVGTPFDDTIATDAGSAYVYNGNSVTPSLALNMSSPTLGDRFGTSVSVSGTFLAVGTPQDPTGKTTAGSVTIYSLTGSGTPSPYLTFANPDLVHITSFGRAVSISGSRVAIGAAYNPGDGSDPGVVYVYDVTAQHPYNPVAIISNPAPTLYYHFGQNVCISGTRLVMGMSVGAANLGSALAYDLSVSTSAPIATLSNPDSAAFDLFGLSVAVSGNMAVVGSPGYSIGTANVGRVYVYNLASATPGFVSSVLNNPNAIAGSRFGDALAILGTRVVVGLPSYNASGVSGRVQVFDLSTATPNTPTVTLNNPHAGNSSGFGVSVATSGQLVAVGAPYDSTGGTNSGRSYVYSLTETTPTVAVSMMSNPTPLDQEIFGSSVSIDDATVAVGSPGDFAVAPLKGAVYTYKLSRQLQVAANPPMGGVISGGGTFTIGSSQQLQATANNGWQFLRWSDGNTLNLRIGPVPSVDTLYTALFIPTIYGSWQSNFFTPQQLSDPTVSGPAADPLHDGVPNFFKFYCGLNPTVPLTPAERLALPLLTTVTRDGVLFADLTFRRNSGASGVAIDLQQFSNDTWVNTVPDSMTASTPDPVTGHQTVTMEIETHGFIKRMLLRLKQGM